MDLTWSGCSCSLGKSLGSLMQQRGAMWAALVSSHASCQLELADAGYAQQQASASVHRELFAAVGGERLANGCYSSTIHKAEHLPDDMKKQSNLVQSSGDYLY